MDERSLFEAKRILPDATLIGRSLGGRVLELVATVSPAVAKALLARNKANRKIRKVHAEMLSRMLRSGRWINEHKDGVAVDEDGNLVDGQHRLVAILLSGVSVRMKISWGVPREWRATFGSGAPASASDVMTQLGEVDGRWLAPMYNTIALVIVGRNIKMTATEMLSDDGPLRRFRDGGRRIRMLCEGADRSLTAAPVMAGLAIAHRKHPEAIEVFGKSVFTGAGLEEGSPALILRNAILANGVVRMARSRGETAMKVVRAAMAHVTGEKILKLAVSKAALAFFCPDADEIKSSLRSADSDPEGIQPAPALVADGLRV